MKARTDPAPLIVRIPLLTRLVCLGLLCSGLLGLHTDLSRPKGACCSSWFHNHDAAIRFMVFWCLLLVGLILCTQQLTFQGDRLRVSWLWGLVGRSCLAGQVRAEEVELTFHGGHKTEALKLKIGGLPVHLTADRAGYQEFRLSLRQERT